DPLYEDAVRLVVEFGKASTSLLQRRLRIGYGRAAHLIDLMERDGIVGAADGPKPREVLKRPGWLSEVEESLR
ncbi:MAG TPA: DNA translocase FtsK, partial [Terriglobales bacterium]|nr:DNA translocase FtsK [Terriglobales bacterium]